jgi:hypothetical protein
MHTRSVLLATTAALLSLAACGSSDGSTTASALPTTAAGAVDPNAPEVVEPGDIPDDQVFVTFSPPDAMYSIDVPEGWARTESGNVVTFTDKYNSITVESTSVATTPSVDTVAATGLDDVSSDPTFNLLGVTTVTRASGDVVLATFELGSPPNPVTGKSALLSVERYVYFQNGTEVVLTLSGAKGADNVDPWKIVSDSLTWT